MANDEKDITAQLATRLNAATADLTLGTTTLQEGNTINGGTLALGNPSSHCTTTNVSGGNLKMSSFAGFKGTDPLSIKAGASVTVPTASGEVTVTGPLDITVDELRARATQLAVKK
jgi:hypothetical protein